MATLFEQAETAAQTGRVFLVFLAVAAAIWLLASVSLKVLGVAAAAIGLALLIWFPGRIEHQRKLFTSAILKLGVLMIAAGLALIILG